MGQRVPANQDRKHPSVATGTLGVESVCPGDTPSARYLQRQRLSLAEGQEFSKDRGRR